jgi:hypothetical protein
MRKVEVGTGDGYESARLQELQLAAEEVQASKSAVQTAGEQRYPSSDGGHRPAMAACMARVNNATRAVMVATGQQWLPVWPGLTSRKLRWMAARGCREEVRSRQTARLRELQLAAEEVRAGAA